MIEEFTEKLSLMCDRLSLSRVQLAHAVGVDKSVAARWASGRVRPGEQSIVRLTELVRHQIGDFSRSDWSLSLTEFAVCLGMKLARAPLAADTAGASKLDESVALYGGLWLLIHGSFTGMRRLFAFVLDLHGEDGKLCFELGDGFGYRARGAVSVDDGKLCLAGQAVMHPQQVWPIYLILNGVQIYRAVVLDGLLLSWCRDIGHTPTALRAICWRLAPHAPNSFAARERFEAAAAHIVKENQAGRMQVHLPKWLATEIFDMPLVPVRGALRVPAEQSLAIEEMTLSLVEPSAGRRRQVLRALRELFRPVLAPA
ncbi:MAG TPA: helix-turn-helix transcriptional regulator [Acetobacteraceae bacterium]|nr:helix-turn-helix transcriptional regulator [Acetobacteraceae bacterium]